VRVEILEHQKAQVQLLTQVEQLLIQVILIPLGQQQQLLRLLGLLLLHLLQAKAQQQLITQAKVQLKVEALQQLIPLLQLITQVKVLQQFITHLQLLLQLLTPLQ
tara:strand:+ start:5440 stop:5754 length:315 start_codon:yes stop_codon:yes gene_type:complete